MCTLFLFLKSMGIHTNWYAYIHATHANKSWHIQYVHIFQALTTLYITPVLEYREKVTRAEAASAEWMGSDAIRSVLTAINEFIVIIYKIYDPDPDWTLTRWNR
jgi:heme/copper-type cytochrome/quinol oxidase subunit 2